jgi:hypothetical protein
MPLTVIDQGFPHNWLWGKYEGKFLKSIILQIEKKWPSEKNLLINLTWFSPTTPERGWRIYQELLKKSSKFDNLFLMSTVDPPGVTHRDIKNIQENLAARNLYLLGNFCGDYYFNFFAPVLEENFRCYDDDELLLTTPRWKFICYNRKPRSHRVQLVRKIRSAGLDQHGIITLGKPNLLYNPDHTNDLYLTIGEKVEDYVEWGHWYDLDVPDEFGIPHDVLSLHNIEFWREHFLHIVGATEFSHSNDVFVTETQFKPILGLRPFVINGNVRTYQWLRNNGFRTFNHWWSGVDLESQTSCHDSIVEVLDDIISKSEKEILDIFQEMLPDLIHNRDRFREYAQEQNKKINDIFYDIKDTR